MCDDSDTIDALFDEIEDLRRDSERLDWLTKPGNYAAFKAVMVDMWWGRSRSDKWTRLVRDAIDAKMKGTAPCLK